MRKLLLYGTLMLICSVVYSQKYKTTSGTISFEASVPSFEEVSAESNNASALLNMETGEFAALALVRSFRFKVALMEEHFNENYIESDKYSKTFVKGVIEDWDPTKISTEFQEYMLKATMLLHGVEKEMLIPVLLKKDGDGLQIESSFSVAPQDFRIKIPSIVNNKIADNVLVQVQLSLTPN